MKLKKLTAITPVAAAVGLLFAAPADAWYVYEVTNADGSLYARLNVAEKDDELSQSEAEQKCVRREITASDLEKITLAFRYWSGILGDSVGKPIIKLTSYDEKNDNAGASSGFFISGRTMLQGVVLGLEQSIGQDASISYGLPMLSDSWNWSTISILPRNHLEGDLPGTIIHELMHAYGLDATVIHKVSDGTKISYLSDTNLFITHLYDVYGTQAKGDMPLSTVTAEEALDTSNNDPNLFQIVKVAMSGGVKFKGDVVTQVLRGTDASGTKIYEGGITWTDSDDVAIYNADTTFVTNGTLAEATATNSVTGGLPIVGIESLGKSDEEDEGSSSTETFTEDKSVDAELSHIELQNSLMSHQNWRNWGSLMEAELALMEDLGYTLDRKLYFGTSIYSSGNTGENAITISQAFWARENGAWLEGTASTQSLAIGVHVYGSVNDVTVAADQLANGAESIGVRVDGIGNTVTVASGTTVSANGENGLGVLFSYGRGHSLTLESGSTVTADGTDGRALSFDFGGNEMGDYIEYRGSWIRSARDQDKDGNLLGYWKNLTYTTTSGESSNIVTLSSLDATSGALMKSVSIAGTVSAASGEAIYISPNALVSQITIQSGATVTGDIVSEWNARSKVTAQYDSTTGTYYYCLDAESTLYGDSETTAEDGTTTSVTGVHAQALITSTATEYDLTSETGVETLLALKDATVHDLTTNLVFGDSEDFDFTYSGNITGKDGIRLTFAEGVTTLTGNVTVLGGVINADAAVKGAATYTFADAAESVLDVQARVTDGSGFVQGALVNAGVLWSMNLTGGAPTINGNYLQSGDGTIAVGVSTSGELRTVTVTGTVGHASSDSSDAAETGILLAAQSDETPVSVTLMPEIGYWADGSTVTGAAGQNAIVDGTGSGVGTTATWSNDLLSSISETLAVDESTGTISRKSGAYSNLLGSSASSGERAVAVMLDANAGSATDTNAKNFIAAIDFSDAAVGAAAMGEITGDAHISAVRAQFAVERLLDRTLARVPADAAVSGRHIWAQPFGGRLADNTAGAHSRTKAAGLAGGVTVTSTDQELGFHVAAAYFSESNNLHAKTRGQGLWLGASAAKAIDAEGTW
ncbi:hypothetical protein, partial [Sutterella sp.]|uniref:hypothetical protein n=1 Tax=Sutterella sp. TaxID=1981025 RepID=UPI0026DF9B14